MQLRMIFARMPLILVTKATIVIAIVLSAITSDTCCHCCVKDIVTFCHKKYLNLFVLNKTNNNYMKMVQFSNEEKVDMLLVFGECRSNCREAKRVYAQRYPHRRVPDAKTFPSLCKNLREYGSFVKPKRNRVKTATNDENTAAVIQQVDNNPKISLSKIKENTGVSISSSSRILHRNSFRPYKTKLVHKLEPGDPARRMDFLARIADLYSQDANFLLKILWSDESRFHNNGIVNRHNCRFWSENHPRWITERGNQRIFGINVWCGILNGFLIGPHFYEGTLNANRYLRFLQTTLPELLEEVPFETRMNMWLQQDGAPAHNAVIVTRYLDREYPNRWFGTNGPIRWPARSPDITPPDYFLWGHLKDVVYEEPIEDMADLINKISAACAAITRRTLLQVTQDHLLKVFDRCIRADGHNFEQNF